MAYLACCARSMGFLSACKCCRQCVGRDCFPSSAAATVSSDAAVYVTTCGRLLQAPRASCIRGKDGEHATLSEVDEVAGHFFEPLGLCPRIHSPRVAAYPAVTLWSSAMPEAPVTTLLRAQSWHSAYVRRYRSINISPIGARITSPEADAAPLLNFTIRSFRNSRERQPRRPQVAICMKRGSLIAVHTSHILRVAGSAKAHRRRRRLQTQSTSTVRAELVAEKGSPRAGALPAAGAAYRTRHCQSVSA